MNEIELTINQIAQEFLSIKTGLSWFDRHTEINNGEAVLLKISNFIQQAHPRPNEIDEAIETSELNPTLTPCVILKSKPLNEALNKIVHLPKNEQLKSFKLLIKLFSIADKRRRDTECKDGCQHEWHNIN